MDNVTFKSSSILSSEQLIIIIVFCLVLSFVFFVVKRKELIGGADKNNSEHHVLSHRVSRTANLYIINTKDGEVTVFESEYGVLQLDTKKT